MAVSTTLLSFATTDQNLWAPGAAIELGIDTGDSLIWDPDELTYDLEIGGSFLGVSAQVYLDAKIGLVAYASIGEAGRFGGGIDIALEVGHSAVVLGGQQMHFDFSNYSITQADLDSTGFSVGPKAGIDLVLGFQFGLRDISYSVFGIKGSAGDISIVNVDENITLFSVGPGDLELPFDLGYGLELTLRVPSGADTTGTSTKPIVTSDGFSDSPFLDLSADLDELLTSLLKKIPFPPAAAVANVLEQTIFATFEFDLNDYVPGIDKGIFGIEATVLDIGATIGATVSEQLSLDFSNGDGVTPDVDITLRSDNGTVGDLTDDVITTAKLGDNDVTLQGPGYEGFGPVTVTATYELGDPRFTHNIGIDLVGSFTIEALKAATTGMIGEKLGVKFGPLLSLEFPEGGFRLNVIPSVYSNSFNLAPGAFNTITDSYQIFYSSTAPQGIVDFDKPGVVQELIAYNEVRQINIAASNATFAAVNGSRVAATYDFTNGFFINTASAQFATFRFDVAPAFPGGPRVGNADMQGNLSVTTRDVVNIDAFNNVGVPLGQLSASYTINGLFNPFPLSGTLDASTAHSASGYIFLNSLPFPGDMFVGGPGGIAEGTVLTYRYSGVDFRTENSVNILGNSRDDLLVYWGNEAQLINGGGQQAGSATGDVLVANFARSHPLDAIEWDLRPTAGGAQAVGGDGVKLKLTRGAALYDVAGTGLLSSGYQAVAGVPGAIEIAPSDPDGVALVRTGVLNIAGTFILRVTAEDTANGASSFEVRVVNAANTPVRTIGTYLTNQTRPGEIGGYSDLVIKDIVLNVGEKIEIITYRGGATGAEAEAARISRLQLHEQHEVNFVNIESFMLATSNKADLIFTSTYRDGITFNGGDDTLFLTADAHSEEMDMGIGSDIALIEMKTPAQTGGTGAQDRIFGQLGGDEAIVRNLSDVGMTWVLRTPDPALGTGQFLTGVLGFATSAFELSTALRGLNWVWKDPFSTSREVSLPNSTLPGSFIEARLTSGGFTNSAVLLNFEAVSFEGSDTANDLAFFFGGAIYDGGDSEIDTFVGDFSQYRQVVGQERGVVISGYNADFGLEESPFGEIRTTFTYDEGITFAGGHRVRTSEIKGFERLIVTGTSLGDVLVGGAYADQFEGGAGNDILVGGGSFLPTLASGTFALGGVNEFYGGLGDDTFHVTGAERSLIRPDLVNNLGDQLNFGPGLLAIPEFATFYGTTLTGLRQVFHPYDSGGTVITFGALDSAATLLAATGLITTSNRDFIFETTLGLGAFVSGQVRTNLTGLDATDDLFFADGGATYVGGERVGDRDTFVADFSGQSIALTWNVEQDVAGVTLANGVHVAEMDRVVLKLGSGGDMVTGGKLDDLIYAGQGSDVLRGGGAETGDTIYGGAGADLFGWNADDGNAWLDGGSDAGDTANAVTDRLLVSAVGQNGLALMGVGLSANFHDGTFAAMAAPVTADDATNLLETMFFLQDDGYELRIFSGGNFVTTTGIEAVDVQGSNEHNDLILHHGGNFYDGGDKLGDADIFMADFGSETRSLTITARAGDDRLADAVGMQDIGNGVSIGNFERLFVRTGSGADQVTGGDFGDLIESGDGEDLVDGGAGDDTLDGGAGKDILFYSSGTDVIRGGADSDILEMGNIPGGTLTVLGFQANGALLFDASVHDINSAAQARSELTALFSNVASVESFTALGSSGNLVTYSGIEKVIVSAEEDRDMLVSGTGGGILSGDGGDDVLVGLGGNDLLVGGAGFDRYAVSGAWGKDVIGGEYAGSGEIHFFGWTRAQVTFSVQGGDDLLMRVGANTLLFLDYFANGANGLAYTFAFDDQTVALNLTALGAVSNGAITTGEVYFGTADRDEIFDGTAGSDSYFMREGNDLIAGSAGPDIISGGLGLDAVIYQGMVVAGPEALGVTVNLATGFGQGGDAAGDILISIEDILGSDGRDNLTGSDRRNALAGGEGRDTINGGGGNDFLSGDAGNDRLDGGADDDLILGGSGLDTLNGGTGNDYLNGGADNDSFSGDDGDDTAVGGEGSDTADLGAGNDVWMVLAPEGGVDTVEGNTGSDTIELSALTTGGVVTLGGPFDQAQQLFIDGVLRANLTGFENAVGSGYDDALVGNSLDNRIMGLGGSDRILGHGGNDMLDGGAGFDRLDYSSEGGGGRVIVDLALGTATDTYGNTDTIANFEHVIGSNFVASGLKGDDLFGDAGNNTFTGNKGIDYDLIDGRAGIDTVDYSAESDTQNYLPGGGFVPGPVGQGIVVDLSILANLVLPNATDTSGHGDILINIENIIGSIRGDLIKGNAADNLFVGGDGEDTLEGGGGFDTLDYGAETGFQGVVIDEIDPQFTRDTFGKLDVQSGFERIIGTARGDQFFVWDYFVREIIAGDGDDLIQMLGGATTVHNSRLFGGDGNDAIYGSDSSDFLFGGTGNNFAAAAGGDDVYMSSGGNDTFEGGAGFNLVNFELVTQGVNVDLTTALAFAGLTQILTFTGVQGVKGSHQGDLLTGDAGANLIDGSEGDDGLTGGDGADTIYGGAGRDLLNYGEGTQGVRIDLTLASGNATDGFGNTETLRDIEVFDTTVFADTLKGNDAAQTFVLRGGADQVDGGGGFDTADFSQLAANLAVQMAFDSVTGVLSGTVVTSAGTVVLTGVEHVIGTNSAFDDLFGSDGNEVFTGNAGSAVDVIDGRGGIDTVDYGSETGTLGVTVNLGILSAGAGSPNATDTYGHGDALQGIEVVIGSALGDSLAGGDQAETLYGQDGNDTLAGFVGNDLLHGGDGIDTATYAIETGVLGILSDWRDGSWWVLDTFGGLDRLVGVENLTGTARADTMTGSDADNLLLAGLGNDQLDGGKGDDLLNGQGGNDSLLGFVGNDSLIGGTGVDTLRGEAGVDTLRGGVGADVIDGGEGQDAASYSDSTTAVRITLVDGAATGLGGDAAGDVLTGIEDLIGSAHADSLTGDDFANVLTGGAGIDTLTGGRGNDVYVTDGLDVLVEASGGGRDQVRSTVAITLLANFEDAVLTGNAAVNLTGNTVGNGLFGNAGANQLQGLGGADTMGGGAGSDVYIADVTDTLIEEADQGIDRVNIAANYTLAENFENLTLTGTGHFSGTGNAANNQINGNGGHNTLDGTTGADTLRGGAGNDTLVTDGGDVLIEALDSGTDLVLSSVSLTLGANLENLTLTGTTAVAARGNGLANVLIGNAVGNQINGGAGIDTLTGGAGLDDFVFDLAPGAADADVITDFTLGEDRLRLDDADFLGLARGVLAAGAFSNGAVTSQTRIIHDTATGVLYFDADGSAAGLRLEFARVSIGVALTAADFVIF
ncbi:calcium-binding protein [Stagnihabitans tardus]|uniref:Uncharacterized protein n=1 Tax=Stagnihabitans tardus TaxID=2699202 RepID=A0AAE4Y5W4_9RHOB|nr:hypothetical protein [Stagnihabitans tardus]NBZ86338.1 hypothetical protein [Stagnihabitans tardus]